MEWGPSLSYFICTYFVICRSSLIYKCKFNFIIQAGRIVRSKSTEHFFIQCVEAGDAQVLNNAGGHLLVWHICIIVE